MFWTWLEDLPDVDMEEAFANMEEAGIEAVMLHAASVEDYKKDIEIAKRHGVKVYAWLWTLNPPRQDRAQMLEAHPDWFDVNRNGESLVDHKAYVKKLWVSIIAGALAVLMLLPLLVACKKDKRDL